MSSLLFIRKFAQVIFLPFIFFKGRRAAGTVKVVCVCNKAQPFPETAVILATGL